MEADRPSQTAVATAFLRALHLRIDDAPPVFADPLAEAFLPDYLQRFLRRLGDLAPRWVRTFRNRQAGATQMRAQVLLRARYAEDALAAARRRGIARYVILGAGFDSYAQRCDGDALPVVEIDHPATQSQKLARLGAARPQAAVYLPVDFEDRGLRDALDPTPEPQMISWLGTTYYLDEGAIRDTLTTLAGLSAPGSELVLDYWRDAGAPGPSTLLLWGTRIATQLQAEPMRSFFSPREMERLVSDCGWRIREHCAPEIQNERYLTGRRDGLRAPAFAYLLHLER